MASEQYGKYYGHDLRPIYEVPSKDGTKMVRVTIRHAKEMGLLYSVSRILEEHASYELVEYQKEQVALAAIEYPYDYPDKSPDNVSAYVAKLKAKADEFRTVTAERGKEIHGAIERYFKSMPVDTSDPVIATAISEIEAKLADWGMLEVTNEKAIGGKEFGCVGTPDLVAKCSDGVVRIVDIKTTDLAKFKAPYTKWLLQLGAYTWLSKSIMDSTEIWQCVVDRLNGHALFVKHDNAQRWQDAFKHLFEYTCLITGYDPRKA